MSQAARLRRYLVGSHETVERTQDCAAALHGVRCRIYSNHRVSASVQQTFKSRKKDPGDIIGRVIRLKTYPQNSASTHGVSATRDIAYLASCQNQILVTHDFGYRGRYFRD